MPAASKKSIDSRQQLRTIIAKLSPSSPLTDRFSAEWNRLSKRSGQRERQSPWYQTQHEHWLGWLQNYDGPGGYNRKDWNRSARFVYSHIVNPQMLIYLAEGARVSKATISDAVEAALDNRSTMASMSAAIRRVIPWETVEQALLNRPRSAAQTLSTR